MIGTGAQVTVTHKESKRTPGKMYAVLASVAPVMDEMADKVLPVSAFTAVLGGATSPAASAPAQKQPAGAVNLLDEEEGHDPF